MIRGIRLANDIYIHIIEYYFIKTINGALIKLREKAAHSETIR